METPSSDALDTPAHLPLRRSQVVTILDQRIINRMFAGVAPHSQVTGRVMQGAGTDALVYPDPPTPTELPGRPCAEFLHSLRCSESAPSKEREPYGDGCASSGRHFCGGVDG